MHIHGTPVWQASRVLVPGTGSNPSPAPSRCPWSLLRPPWTPAPMTTSRFVRIIPVLRTLKGSPLHVSKAKSLGPVTCGPPLFTVLLWPIQQWPLLWALVVWSLTTMPQRAVGALFWGALGQQTSWSSGIEFTRCHGSPGTAFPTSAWRAWVVFREDCGPIGENDVGQQEVIPEDFRSFGER